MMTELQQVYICINMRRSIHKIKLLLTHIEHHGQLHASVTSHPLNKNLN